MPSPYDSSTSAVFSTPHSVHAFGLRVSTTDATLTPIPGFDPAPPTGRTVRVCLEVVAFVAGSSTTTSFERRMTLANGGTEIPHTDTIGTDRDAAAILSGGGGVSITSGGGHLTVSVTGLASTNIDWTINFSATWG